jgi:exopolyphosphatase / guanosine-5'-triphosphate,3'-diphosphate pyrophosphatase
VTTQRLAVVDLGSNSFRLVVFTWVDDSWFRLSDEIHEVVRIGEGLEETGVLAKAPMERALETVDLYAHFCRATGIDEVEAVATSAIRDATNRDEFLERAALDVRVLATEEEAFYGYLAAVNSTTLSNGVALDIGGGSMQLTLVKDREARDMRSWPFGAVRMTERFLSREPVKPKHMKALREHIGAALGDVPWLGKGGALAGVGGTVRNLGTAAMLREELPTFGVQGFPLRRKVLDDMIEDFAEMSPAERGQVRGIKPERGDLILAGALVVQAVMEAGGFDSMEVTEAGLREGVFFSRLLKHRDPPLFNDVRRASVRNLAAEYDQDSAHTAHVAELALTMWDALGTGDPVERELLWAAAMLHDIGMSIDYDDHHKHSRYLILNAGLPGFSPRETALIGQMTRFHRKGNPRLGPFAAFGLDGDEELLTRCSAVLRVAEQLERSRDQAVDRVDVRIDDGRVELRLEAHEDVSIARWAAMSEADVFKQAFGRELEISEAPRSPKARPSRARAR